eukprot:NODE_27749_length_502_cov_1.882667.p3 GENE.NODE_27749_length_502_cov_1.882667~~NODE_27749_length_502_cov_1.882667.p3  ORF type:complete len:81 (-),score=13.49 NODE_27749_length_502_cov_1.882667:157-399(-)
MGQKKKKKRARGSPVKKKKKWRGNQAGSQAAGRPGTHAAKWVEKQGRKRAKGIDVLEATGCNVAVSGRETYNWCSLWGKI